MFSLQAGTTMAAAKPIEFYFDLASPCSYIAAERLEGFAKEVGRETVWKPVVLGGIFKATGNEMPARIKEKAAWMTRDLRMSCQMYGLDFRFPKAFPIRTIAHHRALLAAEAEGGQDALRRLALAFYRAYWGEGHDITQPEWFTAAAASTGLSPELLINANNDEAIKQKLIANTDEAIARGAFGAPTFMIGDQLFWGNDRFEMMRFYIEHVEIL